MYKSSKGNIWTKIGNSYLLLNTYTGAVDIVEEKIIELLKGNLTLDLVETDLQNMLIKRGYLTTLNQSQELIKLEQICNSSLNYFKRYRNFGIVITYDCNLRCQYCFQRDLAIKKDASSSTMNISQVNLTFDLIDSIIQEESCAKPLICLYGGEPLMLKNYKIIEHILKRGQRYSFDCITNGFHLIDFIPLLKGSDITHLQITIDGPKEMHDQRRPAIDGSPSFDRIINGVSQAVKEGFKVSIRLNIDKTNLSQIQGAINYLISLGQILIQPAMVLSPQNSCYHDVTCSVDDFNYYLMEENMVKENNKQQLEVLIPGGGPITTIMSYLQGSIDKENLPKSFFCGIAYPNIFFDPYGDLYCCYGAVGYEEHKIGTYDEKGTHFNSNYRLWTNRTIFNIPDCRDCIYALLCGGGCALNAYWKTGSIMKTDCINFEEIFKTYIPYFWNKHYKK